MDDQDFMAAVELGEEPSCHLANLRLAWLLLIRHPDGVVEERLGVALRRRAQRTGGTVHQTRTAAWLALVRAASGPAREGERFEQLLDRRRELLDRGLLDRHYAPATLADPRSATVFVPPDRAPLPTVLDRLAG